MNILKYSDDDTPLIFNWTASKSLLEIGKHKLGTKNVQKECLNILFWDGFKKIKECLNC